jgi:type IV pilus assembly protein PilA
MRKALSDVAEKNPQMQAIFEGWLSKIPKIDQPLVSVRSNEIDGVLFRSSWNRSLKQDTALVLAANPVTVGLLAAMAIPAFQKVRMNSQDATIKNNLRQFQVAGQQYMLETGKTTATYNDLVGADKFIKVLKPVDGEDYTQLVLHSEDAKLSIRKENGQTVSIDP